MTRYLARRGLVAGAVSVALAGVARVGEAQDWLPVGARNHLDDVLFLPLVLTAALLLHRVLGAGPAWILPRHHGLAAVVLTGIVFEGLLPRFLGRGVADPRDLVAYLAGWLVFELVANRPACGSGRSFRSSGVEEDSRPCAAHP